MTEASLPTDPEHLLYLDVTLTVWDVRLIAEALREYAPRTAEEGIMGLVLLQNLANILEAHDEHVVATELTREDT